MNTQKWLESKMLIKNLIDEDFVNYNRTSMFVGCHSCSFKCDKLSGRQVCQNSALATSPDIEISIERLGDRYLSNPLSSAVVFGGLEPFDDIENVISFVSYIRSKGNKDDVVIYTGYTEEEITNDFPTQYNVLKTYQNIVVKFGRYIPDQNPHFDEILGIKLQSDNQYAKRIS